MFFQAGLEKSDWTPVVDKKLGFVSIAVEHMICCAGQGDFTSINTQESEVTTRRSRPVAFRSST